MKHDDAFPTLTDLENTDPLMRVGAFIFGCCAIFLLLVLPAKDNAFQGFFIAFFIGPSFLLCYAGVANPVRKTLLGLSLIFAPLALIPDLDSPIDAHLKGDTSNPNYWRNKKK